MSQNYTKRKRGRKRGAAARAEMPLVQNMADEQNGAHAAEQVKS